ncbi:MAG: hypothetical protein IIW24_03550 [Lachnospiraceae bacterium]|nr:hypothetical protein [Lachnospiraceae bacterium]
MVDLLTAEEAKKLPEDIRMCDTPKKFGGYISNNNKCWWWLRSPGYNSNHAVVVDASGAVSEDGYFVSDVDCAVRPVIRVTDENIDDMKEIEDGYIRYLGTKWIDITDYIGTVCLLKKKCLKRPHRFDSESNDYEKSEIKEYIEEWYRRRQEKYGKKV